ncbi:hypothetical protein GHA87_13200 [Enterococcus faecium]|nr:hypothetical protein [Enterococcus faecium]
MRRTERAAYRTKFYSNLSSPTQFDEEPLFEGWEIIDCLEFGSAEASMMVKSNNCSDSLPTTQEVKDFITLEKEIYGEMIARI